MQPVEFGYKMPAEWEIHERTFISWPVKDSMRFPENYESICYGYMEIIKAISEFEKVTLILNFEDLEQVKKLFASGDMNLQSLQIPQSLQNSQDLQNPQVKPGSIDFLSIRHSDSWIRDNGPTFITDKYGKLAAVNWQFNAWGGKYPPWDLDNEVAVKIIENLSQECAGNEKIGRFDAPLIMEGGSIHVDGEGTLITTEQCLLNPNRNPNLDKKQIQDILGQYLGIEKVIWLKNGLAGDETDGHVDNIACFAAPGKIMLQVCDDFEDENYVITKENLEILEKETDARGRKLEIIKVKQPPKEEVDGERLTLSYLNFYFVNGGIILPVFGGKAEVSDKEAEKTLSDTFPERRIKTVNGMGIIREGGNVHCVTQQMPMGTRI